MNVQATLLYRSLRPVDFAAMAQAFNTWIGAEEMAVTYMDTVGETQVLLSNPNFHAVISFSGQKVEPSLVSEAMQSAQMCGKTYDFADAFGAHRMQLSISIGDGPMQVASDVKSWMSRMGTDTDTAVYPLDLKLCVLNGLVQFLVAHDVPELVHWSQSDMVFSADEIIEAADMVFPLPLVVRPTPIYGTVSGTVGVRLEHSQLIAGRTLVMEPSSLPVSEAIGVAMWLMAQRLEGRMQLEHGKALHTPGFPVLYLRHDMPDETDRKGRIVITQTQPGSYDAEPVVSVPNRAPNTSALPLTTPLQPRQAAAMAVPAAPQAFAPMGHPQAQPAPQPQPFFTSERVQQAPTYTAAPVAAPIPAPEPEATADAAAPAPQETEVQAAPAPQPQAPQPAAPQPMQAQPAAAGFANAARSGNPFAKALSTAAPGAVAARPAGQGLAPMPIHHDVDVAAGLTKPDAMPKAEAKGPSPFQGLPTRPITAALVAILLVGAGLFMAPKALDGVRHMAPPNETANFTLETGPDIPGLPRDIR